jgi:hypothetical protein
MMIQHALRHAVRAPVADIPRGFTVAILMTSRARSFETGFYWSAVILAEIGFFIWLFFS